MSEGYLDFDITTDPDELAQLAFDEMAIRLPGWSPIVGEIDTTLLQAVARIASQVRASAGIVPIGVFRYLAELFGMTPLLGERATCVSNWLFNDTDPHTIPAGTVVTIQDADGVDHAFEFRYDLVENDSDGEYNGQELIAVDVGAEHNFSSTGQVVTLVDSLAYVAGGTLTTDSGGGVDSEDDQEFLDRLVATFGLLAMTPILPEDFAIMALQAGSGATRAVALDGYDPTGPSSGNERMVTVFVVDEDGAALSSPSKAIISALIGSRREVNFVCWIEDPDFNTISVKYTAHAVPGFTAAEVEAEVDVAIASYLSPATWGLPAQGSANHWTLGEGWDKVRRGELYQVINAVTGVAYVDTLFLIAGAVLPTTEVADITLTGVAPLAVLSALDGTVT